MGYSALLYAAGLGTRMGALTTDIPKSLIKVNGNTLLDHALEIVDHHNVSDVTINTHFKSELLQEHPFQRPVKFSDEPVLLETGGGLRNAIPFFETNPVITINTDAVWRGPNPITVLLDRWDNQMDALLLIIPIHSAIGHKGSGDFNIDDDGRLTRGNSFIYTGVQIIRTDHFLDVEAETFSTNVVWDRMLSERKLFGAVYQGHWCDVGYPEAIPLAEAMLQRQVASDD